MARQVEIGQDQCVGCFGCVELCPDIFQMGPGEEKAMVMRPEVGADQEACVEEAIETCPVNCIAWA